MNKEKLETYTKEELINHILTSIKIIDAEHKYNDKINQDRDAELYRLRHKLIVNDIEID